VTRRSRYGRLYDFFRDRIMFPIRDRQGALIGFIGRTADGVGGPTAVRAALSRKHLLVTSPSTPSSQTAPCATWTSA
jgi:hypothetical protein